MKKFFYLVLFLTISCLNNNKDNSNQETKDAFKIDLNQGEYEIDIFDTDDLVQLIFDNPKEDNIIIKDIFQALNDSKFLIKFITKEDEFAKIQNLIEIFDNEGLFSEVVSDERKNNIIESRKEYIRALLKSMFRNINNILKLKVIKNVKNQYILSIYLKIDGLVEDQEMQISSEKNILTFNNKAILTIGDEILSIIEEEGIIPLPIVIIDDKTKARVHTLKDGSKFSFKILSNIEAAATEEERDQAIEALNSLNPLNFDKIFLIYNSVNNSYTLNLYIDMPMYYNEAGKPFDTKLIYDDNLIAHMNEILKQDKEFKANPLYFEVTSQGNIKINNNNLNFLKLIKID